MYIRYLKIISNISLAFGIFGFLLSSIGIFNNTEIYNTELLYVWVILTSFLIYRLSSKKVFTILLSVLPFLPVLFMRDSLNITFISIVGIYNLYLLSRIVRRLTYGSSVEEFEKVIPIVIIITIISVAVSLAFPDKAMIYNRSVLPYFVVYLVSTVILLRTLRYIEYSSTENKDMNKVNLFYSVGIITISFLLSLPTVRAILWRGISVGFTYVISSFLMGLAWLVFGVFYLFDKIISLLGRFFKPVKRELPEIKMDELTKRIFNMARTEEGKKLLERKNTTSNVNQILLIIFSIVIILLITYIVYTLFKRYESRHKPREEDYIETKEFITIKKEEGSGVLKRILERLRPKDPVEKIRLYYKRYLLMCKEKEVGLRDSDTTLDIYSKSRSFFNKEVLPRIREIYIKVRYGLENPSNETVKEFIALYKRINSKD
ncbi:MAG: hypothetical protein N2380_02555 [bacterium]|nr:hypothetical protein [bacterium]